MNRRPYRVLKVGGSLLCFSLPVLSFFGEPTTPRIVEVLTATGAMLLGVSFFIEKTKVLPWILLAAMAGILSGDIYEVSMGQRHWLRLLPLPALFLMAILFSHRNSDAA